MNNPIPQNDYEALSAYLDNQLPARERSRLEARLQLDNDLRAELDALRRTRSILRAAPLVRAPRNFTLTPEMAGAIGKPARPANLFVLFRFGFVLFSLLLVFSLAGNLLVPDLPGRLFGAPQAETVALQQQLEDIAATTGEAADAAGAASAAEESAPQVESLAQGSEPVAEVPAEERMAVSETPTEMPTDTPVVEPTATQSDAPATLPTATLSASILPNATAIPGDYGDAPASPTPTGTPAPTETPTLEPSPTAPEPTGESAPIETASAAEDATPKEAGADAPPAEASAAPAVPSGEPDPAGERVDWRDGIVLFGGLALIFGGLALFLRRRN